MSDRFLEISLVNSIGTVIGNDNLGTILLLIAIICLGFYYVVVRYSALYTDLGPLTFIACRLLLATIFLGITLLSVRFFQSSFEEWNLPEVLKWGVMSGLGFLILEIGTQYGEMTETAAQTAFIVGMYVVVIPLMELMLSCCTLKLSWKTWLAVVLDVSGIFLLSGCAETNCFDSFQWGVLYNIIAMLGSVATTMCAARGVKSVGVLPLLLVFFATCAILSLILALAFEFDQWEYPYTKIHEYWWLILSAGVVIFIFNLFISVALCFMSTSRVAIIASIESLSGSIFGYLLLGETISMIEYFGGGMMFIAVLIELISCEAEEKKDSVEMVSETTSLLA